MIFFFYTNVEKLEIYFSRFVLHLTLICYIFFFQFNIDVEMTGKVHFENYIIEGACALWCASAAGHLEVVKSLLSHGADVNHSTKNR